MKKYKLSSEISSLIKNMFSDDIETQIHAYDEAALICDVLAKNAVESFKKDGPACYLLGERLGLFGTLIVPYLRELVLISENIEVKIIASVNLLNLGCDVGEEILLNEVEVGKEFTCLAVNCLVTNNIKKAVPLIIKRLREIEPQSIGSDFESNLDKDIVMCLVDALIQYGIGIPDDIRECFSAAYVPVEIRKAINN